MITEYYVSYKRVRWLSIIIYLQVRFDRAVMWIFTCVCYPFVCTKTHNKHQYQNSICLIHPPILCNSFITYTLLTTTLCNILITFTDVDTYVEYFLTFTVVKTTYIYIYVCVCWQLNCVSICFFVFLHFQLLTTTLCNIFITLSLLHFSCVICVGIKNQSVSIMRGSNGRDDQIQ